MNAFASDHCTVQSSVRPWILPFLLGLVLIVTGCGNSSFVARTYTNFTAYYNTFYNANKAFEEGMESVGSKSEPIDRERYLPVFQPPGDGGDQNFKEAIDKSASLLRKHPDSKWVDDALVLIGKAYYFQRNFVGAEQKFREVIDLDAELEGKARFWLARTLVTADRYEEASQALAASLGEQQDDGTWTDRMHLVRGELAVRQGRWEDAEAALTRGLEGDVPDEAAARGSFLLGQVHETLEQYEAAANAYDRVLEYSPRYELSYAARYNAVRMLGQKGTTGVALDRLRDMERDDKNYDRRFELTLLRGRLYRLQGDRQKARETLRELLYARNDRQQSRPSGTVEGRIHYALGVLYQEAFSDFEKAAAHFDTAATSLDRPSGNDQNQGDEQRASPFAVTDSRDLADRFGIVAERSQSLARMDSLLRLGRMPDDEFQAFVKELEAKRAQEREAQQQARERRASARRFASRGATARRDQQTSRAASTVRGSDGSSFLYHEDPVRVQEARRGFRQTWGDRPRVPNWRRVEAISGSGSEQDAVEQTADAAEGTTGGEGTAAGRAAAQVDVSDVPRDSTSQAEMERSQALARYELGSALFLSANRPDSAAVWFRRVIEKHSDHPIARRALYALAEVHMAQGNTEKGRELYRRLLEKYPDSEFAERALDQLEQEAGPRARNADALADSAYAEAYATWNAGELAPALRSMTRIVQEYPDTPAAPRAALAAGVLYHRLTERNPKGEAPDTTNAKRDTVAARRRTLGARRDTTEANLDTLEVARGPTETKRDTMRVQRDTTGAQIDTTVVERDTTVVQGDTMVARRDTTVARRDSTVAQSEMTKALELVLADLLEALSSPDATTDDASTRTAEDPPRTDASRTDASRAASERPDPGSTETTTDATSDTSAVPAANADTTQGASADSTQIVRPSLGIAADSIREATADSSGRARTNPPVQTVTDSTRKTATDSTATDSTARAIADSTGQVSSKPAQVAAEATTPNPSGSSTDSVGDSAPNEPLLALLRRLKERYPDTPQAKRAQQMIEALTETPEETTGTPADSARAVSDTTRMAEPRTPSDSTAAPDSTASPTVVRDSTVVDSTASDSVVTRGRISNPPPNRGRVEATSDTSAADSTASDSLVTPRRVPPPNRGRAEAAQDSSDADSTQEPIPRPPSRGESSPDSQSTVPSKIPSPAAPDTSSSSGGGT